MRAVLSLLLLLPALAVAKPTSNLPKAARHLALGRRDSSPAKRFANPLLSSRQSTACVTTDCGDAADAAPIASIEQCSSTDTACLCTGLNSLSSACLTCILSVESLSESDFEAACASSATLTSSAASPSGTSDPCTAQCATATDEDGLNTVAACDASDDACICGGLAELDNTCLTCFLDAAGSTQAQFQQLCASTSASASFTLGGTPTTASTGPSASATSCTSTCSSASDQAGVQAVEACDSSDTQCICTAVSKLSTTCRTCVLAAANLTLTQLEELCVASTTGTPTSTSGSVVTPPATSPPASSTSKSGAMPTGVVGGLLAGAGIAVGVLFA